MIVLSTDHYDKVLEPLSKLKINNLFARSIAEKHVKGSIYADNEDTPGTFHIVHPYHMSLLFGKSDNEEFNLKFRDYALNVSNVRHQYEWMQAAPDSWDSVLHELFKDSLVMAKDNLKNELANCIELNNRVNFKFDISLYKSFKPNKAELDSVQIKRMNETTFMGMKGGVVPMYFWNNAQHFCRNGIGFSLFYKGELASTAFSSYIHGNLLEIGIETVENYRGMGLAKYSCSALIDYALKNNYEPVWSCRLENVPSFNLAQKLGFRETKRIPYYRLSN